MNFVNAELTKLSVNTFVTTKISYANMLAEMCEALPGGDVGVVTQALGCDSRIGSKYLKGALGYGGPCFPRDNLAFIALCRRVGLTAPLAEATDAVNRRQPARLARVVADVTRAGGRVGIFGLSYKPDTSVAEQSQGVLIAAELADRGFQVTVHDPMAIPAASKALGDRVRYAATAQELARQSETVVIATPWPEYRTLKPEDFGGSGTTAILDCWGILDPGMFREGFEYLRLGSGPAAGAGEKLGAFAVS
jgi:UDPglucose 6-dehydrogenase